MLTGNSIKKKVKKECNKNLNLITNTIRELNDGIENDQDFIERVKQEIFSNNIYVYTFTGDIIELPNGSTVIDFAYKLHSDMGNHLYKAYINGKEVKITHKLSNKDRIMVVTREKSHPHESWLEHVATLKARRQIREQLKK